jgi:hypothetical protein
MDLLNQTLNSFSTQISDGGVSFNGDIFEANLVNLVLLDGGLVYLLSGALSESLSALFTARGQPCATVLHEP